MRLSDSVRHAVAEPYNVLFLCNRQFGALGHGRSDLEQGRGG
jgi:hypothetical protein